MKKQLSVKAVLSSLLILIFLFLAVSGAMMLFGKTGMVLGIPRGALRSAHAFLAFSMCVIIPVHLFLNRKIYLGELKALFKRGKDNEI